MPASLSALSARNVVHPALQVTAGYPVVLSTMDIGGPMDPADRRLVLDVQTLEHLLSLARSSITGRVVLHHLGLRVQVLRDSSGHIWEHLTLLGSEPKPESALLFGNASSFGGAP